MRRSLVLLLAVSVASAAAGWVAALARNAYMERTSAERAAVQAKNAAVASAVAAAKRTAALVRGADQVVISNSWPEKNGERDVRFRDPAWLAQFAAVIENKLFVATPHGLWISTPVLRFYRNQEQILELMTAGQILRAYGEREGGDFFVGDDTINALQALIGQKWPNKPTR